VGPMKSPRLRRNGRSEAGAETVEFAIVVVLLITLVYGIVSLGLMLGAKVTLTQAASDGARAGIVESSTVPSGGGLSPAETAANSQAASDVSWMGKGTCGLSGTTITCVSTQAPCASNTSNTCLTETVTYNYAKSPLIPLAPGLNIITPTTIVSTSTLQISTPTS
jgi:Flp pilus assembly protein TadG